MTSQAKKNDAMLKNTAKIPSDAYAQKFPNAGKTDVAPMPKASRSVTDVIVIATPECFIARPMRSSKGSLEKTSWYIIRDRRKNKCFIVTIVMLSDICIS